MEMDKMSQLPENRSQSFYLSLLANRVVELQQMNDKLETKINELLQDIQDLLSEKHPMEDK